MTRGSIFSRFRRVRVVRWTGDAGGATEAEASCGGMGGWVDGRGWPEYLANQAPAERRYLKALRRAILAEGLRVGGDDHQEQWTPVFSDNTVGSFSYRAWGDLNAAIYNTHERTTRYGYMDFYMGCLIDRSKT